MRPHAIVIAGSLSQKPRHGGHTWALMQYALGFRELGWDVLFLDQIGRAYGRQGPSQRLSRSILGRLENTRIEDVFENGLHEFISGFIVDTNKLGSAVSEQYLV